MLKFSVKKIFGSFCCAVMLFASSIYATEGDFEISHKMYSPKEAKKMENVLSESGYKDNGHYITFINLVTPAENEDLTLVIERPLLDEKNSDQKITLFAKELEALQTLTENKYPHTLISSRGFLPGELIHVYFSTGEKRSNTLKITPLPVESNSYYDRASISAMLISKSPTMYLICFKNFRDNEYIEITSESCGERIINKIRVNRNGAMTQMPAVVNRARGMNNISFRREIGETMKISIPWGTNLDSYLSGEVKPDFD